MPEYHIPIGDNQDEWEGLDAFTRGYIEAMFFTENGDDRDIPEDAAFDDLAPEALATIKEDCAAFKAANETLLEAAYAIGGYDEERAGNDFWYTRNHHGVGFWDRGLGATGDKLTVMAHLDGEVNLYMGDDGKLYV